MGAEVHDPPALHSGLSGSIGQESSRDQDSSQSSDWAAKVVEHWNGLDGTFFLRLAAVFVVYFIAGKLGQATANIRSSNLGPVWPASGIARPAGNWQCTKDMLGRCSVASFRQTARG